jgi:Zn-dependent peptidase ImmA (M78 family)
MYRRDLFYTAMLKANSLRSELGLGHHPVCAIDVALTMGLEVRFTPIPSFEGAYIKRLRGGTILIPSERPIGRKQFTCAHELAHHVFRHGDTFSLASAEFTKLPLKTSAEETLADAFAGFFLMPRRTILKSFKRYGASVSNPSSDATYVIASWLGVAYEALVNQMHHGYNLIDAAVTSRLMRDTPTQIKTKMLKRSCSSHLVVIDANWVDRPTIDVEVGDQLLVGVDTSVSGDALVVSGARTSNIVISCRRPGIASLQNQRHGVSVHVRVSRKHYAGLADYRHLADPDWDD